jgi:hypothetical protein
METARIDWKWARREFVNTLRLYFLPVTFLWTLITKGREPAVAHVTAILESNL